MLGRRDTDFLIGEEPLHGEAGFFAPSADASSPAAADSTAEPPLAVVAGPLPAGPERGRGSAVRALTPARLTATGLLAAACIALAGISGLPGSGEHPHGSREPAERPERPEVDDGEVAGIAAGEQAERPRHRGRNPVTDRSRRHRPTKPQRTTPPRPTATAPQPRLRLQARPVIASPASVAPPTATPSPSAVSSGPTSTGAQSASVAESWSEFDFER